MQDPKYVRQDLPQTHSRASGGFSLDFMRAKSWKQKLSARLFRAAIIPILWLLQQFWPVLRVGKFVVVTRADDVAAVLNAPDDFPVPFGPEMARLGRGATFLLGLNGPDHTRQRKILGQIIRPNDMAMIEDQAQQFATALLQSSKGKIDAQADLIQRVAAETCGRYFGLPIDDADTYAQWTMACSQLLFADPFGDPTTASMADLAARNIGALIDRSFENARQNGANDDTLLGRLVTLQDQGGDNAPTKDEIRAILLGLSVGFVPTNSMAGGKILDFLARNHAARAAAIAAACNDDTDQFEKILREIMRLAPAIAPGQWRWTTRDAHWLRPGGRKFTVAKGRVVMAATQMALRDPRKLKHPAKFDPERTDGLSFVFGNHVHNCIGERIAIAQLRGTLTPLLKIKNIAASIGRLKIGWLGAFPETAKLEFRDEFASQLGHLIVIPAHGTTVAALNTIIAQINAKFAALKAALDRKGAIHFCSMSAIEAPAKGSRAKDGPGNVDILLLIEVNADGDGAVAVANFADVLAAELPGLFAAMNVDPGPDIAVFLLKHRLQLTGSPWGATALQFYGRFHLNTTDIARQDALARFTRNVLDTVLKGSIGNIASASAVLRMVRQTIAETPAGAAYLLKPNSQKLDINWWDDPQDSGFLRRLLDTPQMRNFLAALVIAACAFAALLAWNDEFVWNGLRSIPSILWLLIGGAAIAALFTALLAALAVLILRRHEMRDPVDPTTPTLQHVQSCAEGEDRPGYVQNPMLIVTPLKKGLFRRLTLAFALWGIAMVVSLRFRPGFVLNMGTIHFARWVRLPGRDTLIFQSNYDGSWESYLEDFITRAHWGQTAAWSNAQGFPRSRFLINGGAADGDNFKRYVRLKQVPTQFWYARFPELTNATIRRNALIHDGLARARTESEARNWLALFGSGQATDGTLETDEVQALVFSGFGKLHYSTALPFQFGDDLETRKHWLRLLTGFENAESLFETDADRADRASPRIAFGETVRKTGAVSLALTAKGLGALGFPNEDQGLGEHALPAPFALGMANRSKRLGDEGDEAPDTWHWTDTGDDAVHGMMLLYGHTQAELDRLIAVHRRLARMAGIRIVADIKTMPLFARGEQYDHFGFRDGVVQPVIAGTRRAASATVASDIIPPGEMLMGYKNAQGYFTPPIPVSSADDPLHRLATIASKAERFPRFGHAQADQGLRDFARNGTFLAVRQLEQDVATFQRDIETAAEAINDSYPDLSTLYGQKVDADWVAAKIVGRRKNGASLIGRADGSDQDGPMLFGTDDPSGHACPLGAHVRRANPRDSFEPGDPTEIAIVNRHRLLRRGRSYDIEIDGVGRQQGLFFMAICQDIERQFEFVQRTWLDSPVFHELNQQNDPLIGRCPQGAKRSFDIPTPSGPVKVDGLSQFVRVRAGGYFFVPSRSAMLWLSGL